MVEAVPRRLIQRKASRLEPVQKERCIKREGP